VGLSPKQDEGGSVAPESVGGGGEGENVAIRGALGEPSRQRLSKHSLASRRVLALPVDDEDAG
jgi:hypothetical protein